MAGGTCVKCGGNHLQIVRSRRYWMQWDDLTCMTCGHQASAWETIKAQTDAEASAFYPKFSHLTTATKADYRKSVSDGLPVAVAISVVLMVGAVIGIFWLLVRLL